MLSRSSSVLLLALVAPFSWFGQGCDDAAPPVIERDDGGPSPAIDGCTPKECGPRPATPNFVCADGTLAGPGACQRLDSGRCGYPSHACVEPDAGETLDGGAQPDAMLDDASSTDAAVPQCGTRGSPACKWGEFCALTVDTMCGALDQGGSCQLVPDSCDDSYDPVCGCDNRTYGNACAAYSKSVSVAHRGLCTADECIAAGGQPTLGVGALPPACPEGDQNWRIGRASEPALCCLSEPVPGGMCGGIGGIRCKAGLFCNYEPEVGGSGCIGADVTGICSLREELCTKDYRPVCGCDHRTYVNACSAHAASVSVLHEGSCTERDCKFVGGHPVDGVGTGPVCAEGEEDHGPIVYTTGELSIEGTICCIGP